MARTRTASDHLVERLIEWGIDVAVHMALHDGPTGPSTAPPERHYTLAAGVISA